NGFGDSQKEFEKSLEGSGRSLKGFTGVGNQTASTDSNVDALRNLRWEQKLVWRARLIPVVNLRFDLAQLLLKLDQVILNDRVGEVIVSIIAQSREIHGA